MIYCKCDILLPVWICVYLHQTFSMVYYSALLLFFCRNQLLLFLPWIYRQHFLLCIFKLASCISHHNNRLLRNHIHSLYVSDMLQCMIHYCLLSGANVWIFSVIISKSASMMKRTGNCLWKWLNFSALLSLSVSYHVTVSFVSVKYFFTAATLQTTCKNTFYVDVLFCDIWAC